MRIKGIRSRSWRTALLSSLLALPSLCWADNVLYSNAERDLAPPGSIFLDRNGELYPDPSIELDTDAIALEAANPYESVSLKGHYRREYDAKSREWTQLLARVGVKDATGSFDDVWARVQSALLATATDRINALSGDDHKSVFLLVQGFNNTFLEAHNWYRLVRRDITARVPNAVVIEVFWDGGTNPIAFPVWWAGQNNFRFAGLELRRILKNISTDTPIRIISHSSGGPAVANAFGDASQPFQADRDEEVERQERYFERAAAREGDYAPTKRRDLRVAMIVPAGAPNTFDRFRADASTPLERLIIGQNPLDYAVTKAGAGCGRFGDTCLAVNPKAFCDTRWRLRSIWGQTSILGFDMSRSPNGTNAPKYGYREDHAMVAYLGREDWGKILDALLAETLPPDELSADCDR